jgi:hypothetical protein
VSSTSTSGLTPTGQRSLFGDLWSQPSSAQPTFSSSSYPSSPRHLAQTHTSPSRTGHTLWRVGQCLVSVFCTGSSGLGSYQRCWDTNSFGWRRLARMVWCDTSSRGERRMFKPSFLSLGRVLVGIFADIKRMRMVLGRWTLVVHAVCGFLFGFFVCC